MRSNLEMKSQTRDSTSTVKIHSRVNINQTYFNNAPKIMLETISARTATVSPNLSMASSFNLFSFRLSYV
jgi:hypothetical protein